MLEFQLLIGAVSFAGLLLIALGQPPAPSYVRVRRGHEGRTRRGGRAGR